VRLAGAITQGSGAHNEDGLGFLGALDNITAAWIFDGVTGINPRNHLPAATDAQWIVRRADAHLRILAAQEISLQHLLGHLVDLLIADFAQATAGVLLPPDYDPPATCLILAKHYASGWHAMRLGDSALLTQSGKTVDVIGTSQTFDTWQAEEVRWRNMTEVLDTAALMAMLRPEQLARRRRRNTAGGYSILEAAQGAKAHAEFYDLGSPDKLLLCTDGFYRAVDHYGLFSPSTLMDRVAEPGGMDDVLTSIRATESQDSGCVRFPRLKPSDDATALCLASRTRQSASSRK
jgi:Protein phosphatase 2C